MYLCMYITFIYIYIEYNTDRYGVGLYPNSSKIQRIQRLIMIYPLNHCKFGIPFQLGNDYSKSIGCHLSGVMTTG